MEQLKFIDIIKYNQRYGVRPTSPDDIKRMEREEAEEEAEEKKYKLENNIKTYILHMSNGETIKFDSDQKTNKDLICWYSSNENNSVFTVGNLYLKEKNITFIEKI